MHVGVPLCWRWSGVASGGTGRWDVLVGVSSSSGLVDVVYVSSHSLYSCPMATDPMAFLPS